MTEEELETNRATWVSVSRMIRHAVDVFAVCLGSPFWRWHHPDG